VTGSVIHCVAADGAGIMTAMVIAGSKMTDSVGKALWMGGRAEFFSMITVMAGMGIGMGFLRHRR
jgi:hypothetical protein